MARRGAIWLLALGLVATACSTAHASAPSTSTPAPTNPPVATQRIVVRPVTTVGTAVTGYRVLDQTSQSVDCSLAPKTSPASVSPNILWCSPTAAYAIACWPSAHSTVLCLTNAQQRRLTRYAATGVTSAPQAARPVPLDLVLAGRTECTLRDGGAWSQLRQHPDWVGWYSCTGGTAVWGPVASQGLDASHPLWTVEFGPQSGTGPVQRIAVASAYFVGTAT